MSQPAGVRRSRKARAAIGAGIATALATSLAFGPTPARSEEHSLGGHPVCEASAAVFVPCPEMPVEACLLVGDNEARQQLFIYPFDRSKGELRVADRRILDLRPVLAAKDDHQLSDIEAMLRLSDGQVLVYGSHSRNNRCERNKKRRRFVGIELGEGGSIVSRTQLVRTKKGADLGAAFDSANVGTLKLVADAVRRGEAAADAGDCRQAFNIEAAVAFPGSQGDEVWVGLRSPLIDGQSILLRHDFESPRLRFTDARLLNLGGVGVRGLTAHDGWIWGISGRVAEGGDDSHGLWRIRADQLGEAKKIEVEQLGRLPGWSEGIAIHDQWVVVVSDGRVGAERCENDAHYTVLPLPPP